MRHIISLLVSNESGALARVSALFSTRGYNIESLNVAPTQNPEISRLTLVTRGSDTVIEQINQQLLKLVDVVNIADMTMDDHIEREMLLLKVRLNSDRQNDALEAVNDFGARILDDNPEVYTLELTGISEYVDEFVKRMGTTGTLISVVRSGAMAVSRGKYVLGGR
ncbi:MAG: acetolactate synthase small subunit [Lysobacterales bacterium]|jgi:acetolactate synthase-1/3 small subunit